MTDLATKIKIMQAALDGKKIEITNRHNSCWELLLKEEPLWNWDDFDYRIKPEPLELMVDIYDYNTERPRYEIASDRNRLKFDGQAFKTIKVREVLE